MAALRMERLVRFSAACRPATRIGSAHRLLPRRSAPPSQTLTERRISSSSARKNSPGFFAVELTPSNELIVTQSGKQSKLHNLWLRDHCRCPECFHSITKQRLFDTFKLDSTPIRAEAAKGGLAVIWNDKHANSEHTSFYPWSYLKDPKDTSRQPEATTGITRPGKYYWTRNIAQAPPTVSYEAVMNHEKALLECLEKVSKYGFCFVNGVPSNPEDTERLIRRIAFIRVTHYGGFWDFTADLAHGDTAYTNLALKAHTDSTYFTDPCGLQIFHLLSHTEGSGGESLLVDGFRAAAKLGYENKKHLKALSQTLVPTHAVGDSDFHYIIPEHRGNAIVTMDPEGNEPARISYNNDDRGTIHSKSLSELDEWYAALTHWDSILSSRESEYWFQLMPGTVVVIDNQRVLHGRAAFTGKRRMCGAYIGADDYLARLRALRYRQAVHADANDGGNHLNWTL